MVRGKMARNSELLMVAVKKREAEAVKRHSSRLDAKQVKSGTIILYAFIPVEKCLLAPIQGG